MSSSKAFNCPLCVKVFPDQTELNAHTISHTKEKPHKCPTCFAAFGLSGNLQQHVRAVHGGVKRIYKTKVKCSSCDYECGTPAKMKAHSRKHSAERPFTCSKSGCSFDTKYVGSLRKHVRVEHGNTRSFKCPSEGCSYQSKYSGGLKSHLKIHSEEKPFSCTIPGCNQTFKMKAYLKYHINVTHNDEKPFKCSSCDFETKFKFRLRQHEDDHKNIKRFHCQFPNCHHASNHKVAFERHFDSMHRKKNVFCTAPGCDFRCGSIALLTKHAKVHFLPILKCPHDFCSFSTKNPTNLRKHFSCRHGENLSVTQVLQRPSPLVPDGQVSELTYLVCPFPDCAYQTEFVHLYDKHLQTHDKGKGKYACNFCPMRFSAYSILDKHIPSHTGERALSCVHCAYSTAYPGGLRHHARKRHGIHVIPRKVKATEVQKCRLCKKICMSQYELVLHSMKHLQPVVVLERIFMNTK